MPPPLPEYPKFIHVGFANLDLLPPASREFIFDTNLRLATEYASRITTWMRHASSHGKRRKNLR